MAGTTTTWGRRRALSITTAALVLCAALAAGALAATTNFAELGSSPEAAGDGPVTIVATDLDGDTDQDLAIANQSSEDVTILKNNGSGNFTEPASSPEPVGILPTSIVATDLDGDLDQDLAVANFASDDVTILKNTGAGNFNQPASSPESAGANPDELAAGDLDGDGDQDLAVANSTSGDVSILRNSGSGNFSQPASSPEPAGVDPRYIVAVDLDGDLDRDLAVANSNVDTVTILLNNGSANFSQPATSPEAAGNAPISIAAADLDGDTDVDLAVANNFSDDLTVLRNNGSGNFNQPASSPEPAGTRPQAVVAADFDLDGDHDLAVSGMFDTVTILRNGGLGNFGVPTTSPEAVGDAPFAIAAADLDGDGDADLATANVGSDDATILRNVGTPPAPARP